MFRRFSARLALAAALVASVATSPATYPAWSADSDSHAFTLGLYDEATWSVRLQGDGMELEECGTSFTLSGSAVAEDEAAVLHVAVLSGDRVVAEDDFPVTDEPADASIYVYGPFDQCAGDRSDIHADGNEGDCTADLRVEASVIGGGVVVGEWAGTLTVSQNDDSADLDAPALDVDVAEPDIAVSE